MSEKEPNPLSDVARGLGLLFRAARTAARKLPTKDLEEVVVTSAREVGRAFENVATTIERNVIRGRPRSDAKKDDARDPRREGADAPTDGDRRQERADSESDPPKRNPPG